MSLSDRPQQRQDWDHLNKDYSTILRKSRQMALSRFCTSSMALSKIISLSQLDVIPGVRNHLKHKRNVRMISEQSNDQYPRALTELVIFAHSKINNHIQ